MTEFVCGLIGLLLGAALFAMGFFAPGGRDRRRSAPAAADADEAERLTREDEA